jgi:hypothetical protein
VITEVLQPFLRPFNESDSNIYSSCNSNHLIIPNYTALSSIPTEASEASETAFYEPSEASVMKDTYIKGDILTLNLFDSTFQCPSLPECRLSCTGPQVSLYIYTTVLYNPNVLIITPIAVSAKKCLADLLVYGRVESALVLSPARSGLWGVHIDEYIQVNKYVYVLFIVPVKKVILLSF